jgi:RNA polymerase sigma factor (sigma-70 family)
MRLPVQMEQAVARNMAEQRKQNIVEVVRNYGRRLFSFIRGRVNSDEDAEDILQDVWYRFTQVLDSEPIEQTGAWLYRVARNRIIDRYRKPTTQSLDEQFEEPDGDEELKLKELLLKDPQTPETTHLRNRFWQELFAALDELPEEQKQVYIWHELEDLSFNEIAEKTNENVKTLISRKRYAVLHLRKRLETLYREIIES